jgi:chaperonin GroEL
MARRHTAVAAAPSAGVPPLVFQPDTYQGMQRGINVIAGAVRPTLGPLPRLVAVDPVSRGNRQPELLDSGGLIARRILELPDRDADVGAMLLRQLLWKQHEEAGDGTATTAVLFQAVYNEGARFIAAGGNAMRLRHYLEAGMRVVLDQLAKMAVPLDGQEQIARLALSISHDGTLAAALGEIFDIIGEHGLLEIRSGHSRAMEWEFVEGTYYKGGIHAQAIAATGQRSVELVDAAVFVSDLDIEEPEQLVRLIALAHAAKKKALVVVTRKLSEKVVGLLASINRDTAQFQAIAAKVPDEIREQAAVLDDLSVLTGARVFLRSIGDVVDTAQVDHLGAARRVWADHDYFGVVNGKGSPHELRSHFATLSRAYDQTEDLEMRKKLRERIGKLLGGAAVLRVGGSTDLEINVGKKSAERTANALRGALASGVLSGGGAALLDCRPLLRRMADHAQNLEERMAYRILLRALEEPTRAIVENAGYEAEPILQRIEAAGTGFDVRCGRIATMADAGVLDSAGVIMSAVRGALASAALALTVDVLMHHRKPETAIDP